MLLNTSFSLCLCMSSNLPTSFIHALWQSVISCSILPYFPLADQCLLSLFLGQRSLSGQLQEYPLEMQYVDFMQVIVYGFFLRLSIQKYFRTSNLTLNSKSSCNFYQVGSFTSSEKPPHISQFITFTFEKNTNYLEILFKKCFYIEGNLGTYKYIFGLRMVNILNSIFNSHQIIDFNPNRFYRLKVMLLCNT